MFAILISILFAVMLLVASVINFIVAKKQKDKTDDHLLTGSGVMIAVSAVFLVVIVIIVSSEHTAEAIKAGVDGVGGILKQNPELAAAFI